VALDCSWRTAADLGDFIVGQSSHTDQRQRLALLVGQLPQRAPDVIELAK